VIAMTEPPDWPFEQPAEGTLRPWYLTASGYLMVLFSDPGEAHRARRGLLEREVAEQDLRLYESEEILRILDRLRRQRSILARAVAALAADPGARQRFMDNARSGGAILWLVAPTKDRADQLVSLLADYDYASLRYYGEDGVADLERDPGGEAAAPSPSPPVAAAADRAPHRPQDPQDGADHQQDDPQRGQDPAADDPPEQD
jgi:hypothetical protein